MCISDQDNRLTVKLDLEWDADLIGWLEGMAPGNRSALIREMLRAGLRQPARWEPVDIEGKYGAKLDRMLGGLAAGCADEEDAGNDEGMV